MQREHKRADEPDNASHEQHAAEPPTRGRRRGGGGEAAKRGRGKRSCKQSSQRRTIAAHIQHAHSSIVACRVDHRRTRCTCCSSHCWRRAVCSGTVCARMLRGRGLCIQRVKVRFDDALGAKLATNERERERERKREREGGGRGGLVLFLTTTIPYVEGKEWVCHDFCSPRLERF